MNATLYILDFGFNMADNSIFVAGENPGKRVKIPVIGAYIDHPDGKILVDAGVSNLEQTEAINCQYTSGPDNNPVGQLAKLNVKPEEIDYVVLTHLHWDHTGNITKFPNAKVFVRREELKEGFVPTVVNDPNYYRPDYDQNINWELLPNGVDFELVKGVTLLSVPGHTPGTQNVLVQTSEGPVIHAADSVYWYKNWNEGKLPGICFSAEKWLQSVAKMKSIYGVTLIPGHEPTLDVTRVYGQ